jgi:hypothetical protein
MAFNDHVVAQGTGFIWKHEISCFLITNWHNFSGRNPFTGEQISKTKPSPNKITLLLNEKGRLGKKFPITLGIRDSNDTPLWLVHSAIR